MKRFKRPLNHIINFLPYPIVFIFTLYSPSDPDLGWHLKYGEYFIQHGSILRDNTFSTMMTNYQWANTSWLTDVISYLAFTSGGFLGLTLLSSLVVTLTFFFFSRVARLTLWDQAFLFPLLAYLVQPINAISFRGQQLSLLLIGVLFYIISFYPKKPKVFFFLVPLFLLWANLHGQFIFGLALLGGWIGIYLFTNALQIRANTSDLPNDTYHSLLRRGMFLIGIFVLSSIVTVINPFGIGIHAAALSHFGSPLLKNISEYLPFDIQSQSWWNQIIVGIGIVMGSMFLYFKNKLTARVPLLGVSLIIFILSFGVRRYAWPAYYMILPLLQPLSLFLKPDNKRIAHIMTVIFLTVLFGIAVVSRYPFTKYTTFDWNDYCATSTMSCSPKAVEYMQKQKLTKDLYTLYGWGGWLIWRYPEIKPTIDGRMHLWKDEKSYSGFVDYYNYEQNFKDINDSPYNTVLMSSDKPVYDRLEQLVKERKWKKVYEDEFAGVFVRI